MQIDWFSLLIVTATTLVAAVFIMVIVALAARMLDLIHLIHRRRREGREDGVAFYQIGAAFFLMLAGVIFLFGLWLMIPYFH